MSPRRYTVDPSKGVIEVDWALFGELSRALALKVARGADPDVVVGIATAGVVPGATVAAILGLDFYSLMITRKKRGEVAAEPAVLSGAPTDVRDMNVLIVDETCDSGATMRLAKAAIVSAGASKVWTAVSFRTGKYEPDFHALATESTIVLPWDREVLIDGELRINPLYDKVLEHD
jgi:hypoxanthine phosphoribosyltransferase